MHEARHLAGYRGHGGEKRGDFRASGAGTHNGTDFILSYFQSLITALIFQ